MSIKAKMLGRVEFENTGNLMKESGKIPEFHKGVFFRGFY